MDCLECNSEADEDWSRELEETSDSRDRSYSFEEGSFQRSPHLRKDNEMEDDTQYFYKTNEKPRQSYARKKSRRLSKAAKLGVVSK